MSSPLTISTYKKFWTVEKNEQVIELIDVLSWSHDKDSCALLVHFEGWSSAQEKGTSDLFVDIPYHQDFYEVMKEYCHQYEMFMLKKFSE